VKYPTEGGLPKYVTLDPVKVEKKLGEPALAGAVPA